MSDNEVRISNTSLWPDRSYSEWNERPPQEDRDCCKNILDLCFDTTNYRLREKTIITNTTKAIKACIQCLNFKSILYDMQAPVSNQKKNDGQSKKTSRTPQKEFISTRTQRIKETSEKITNTIKNELKEIFDEDFDIRKLHPVECLEHEMGAIQSLCNNPKTKTIFNAFDFKIDHKTFFDCLFEHEELDTMNDNVQLLEKSNFFENKSSRTAEKKLEYMTYLNSMRPLLLKSVYQKYYITPENLRSLTSYLCNITKKSDIDEDILDKILTKRETPLQLTKRSYNKKSA